MYFSGLSEGPSIYNCHRVDSWFLHSPGDALDSVQLYTCAV